MLSELCFVNGILTTCLMSEEELDVNGLTSPPHAWHHYHAELSAEEIELELSRICNQIRELEASLADSGESAEVVMKNSPSNVVPVRVRSDKSAASISNGTEVSRWEREAADYVILLKLK